MTLPRWPLIHFALVSVAGVAMTLLLVWAVEFATEASMLWVEAAVIGIAALIARIRTWLGALGALLIAVAAHIAIMVIPLFLLLGGTFNRVANRQLTELAIEVGGIFALPILAGTLVSAYRQRLGENL
jgi:membrane protein YdbS with pleckstrin-like domain